MKKVFLVTGVTGMLGSEFVDFLLNEHDDFKVFGLLRWRSPLYNIEHVKDKLELVYGDFRDANCMSNIIEKVKPDFILHSGAQSYVQTSFSSPVDTVESNVIGTINLLEAVQNVRRKDKGYNPKVLVVSSSEVYGNPNVFPTPETTQFKPNSPYAFSKCCQDLLVGLYFRMYGLEVMASRAYSHFSKRRGEVFVESSFCKQVAELEKKHKLNPKEKLVIKVGNLDSLRSYQSAYDVCRAYFQILTKGKGGESYNIGGVEEVTIKQLLDIILSLSPIGNKIKIETDPSRLRPADVTKQLADNTKILALFNGKFERKLDLKNNLGLLLDEWRKKVN